MPDANSVSLSSIFFFFVRASLSALHFPSCWILVALSFKFITTQRLRDGLIRGTGAGGCGCRHSGCFCSGRLPTCLLPEPNMWFNPRGTGWHFRNVSAAFCTCLHSSTRHGGEGAAAAEASLSLGTCAQAMLETGVIWGRCNRFCQRKTEKEKVICVQSACVVCAMKLRLWNAKCSTRHYGHESVPW